MRHADGPSIDKHGLPFFARAQGLARFARGAGCWRSVPRRLYWL